MWGQNKQANNDHFNILNSKSDENEKDVEKRYRQNQHCAQRNVQYTVLPSTLQPFALLKISRSYVLTYLFLK